MADNQMLFTKLSHDDIHSIVQDAVGEQLQPLNRRLEELKNALKTERPAFDREMAAWYCHKSVTWIDKRRQEDNLPAHKVGGTPHFKRKDLDHLLNGGQFTEEGIPCINSEHKLAVPHT